MPQCPLPQLPHPRSLALFHRLMFRQDRRYDLIWERSALDSFAGIAVVSELGKELVQRMAGLKEGCMIIARPRITTIPILKTPPQIREVRVRSNSAMPKF